MKPHIIALCLAGCLAGCSKPAPVKVGLSAAEAAQRCPQGWTQRSGKWVCHDPRVQEIYYNKLPAQFLADAG